MWFPARSRYSFVSMRCRDTLKMVGVSPYFEISWWCKCTFHLVLLKVWARPVGWAWKIQVLLWILQLSPIVETVWKNGTKHWWVLSLVRNAQPWDIILFCKSTRGPVLYLCVFMFAALWAGCIHKIFLPLLYVHPPWWGWSWAKPSNDGFLQLPKPECPFQMKNSYRR